MATMPTDPLAQYDLQKYLASLDLSNPGLARILRDALGGLITAVPPAGEYTTGIDYQTLVTALTGQYVGDVIKQYEAILGEVPELYESAVAAGYITPEQAEAFHAEGGFEQVGTLQQKYAAQGGLRTLQGPYTAERTEILKQAMADIQVAAQKASSEAYELAAQTTQTRVGALDAAGRSGVGLVNAGVSRRNAQGLAGGEGAPFELPVPPQQDRPEWWEQALPAMLAAAVGGGLKWLGEPGKKSPEEIAETERRLEEARGRVRGIYPQRELDEAAQKLVPPLPQGAMFPSLESGPQPFEPADYGMPTWSPPPNTAANPFSADTSLYGMPSFPQIEMPTFSYADTGSNNYSSLAQNPFGGSPYGSGYDTSGTQNWGDWGGGWDDWGYDYGYDYSGYDAGNSYYPDSSQSYDYAAYDPGGYWY